MKKFKTSIHLFKHDSKEHGIHENLINKRLKVWARNYWKNIKNMSLVFVINNMEYIWYDIMKVKQLNNNNTIL